MRMERPLMLCVSSLLPAAPRLLAGRWLIKHGRYPHRCRRWKQGCACRGGWDAARL